MKITRWQRAVSLLLCLLMAMSFFTVTAPKAYAADDATEESKVSWPQLTAFDINAATDGNKYVYNSYTANGATVKYKVTGITITQHPELITKSGDTYAGEVHINVEEPVSTADGTTTAVTRNIWLAENGYTGAASNGGTVDQTVKLKSAQSSNKKIYANVSSTSIVKITYTEDGTDKTLYYSVHVKIGSDNSAPTLRSGRKGTATATATVGKAWELNLDTIFTDAENDPLTYKVKVNDAAEATINGSTYSYTPPETEADNKTTLVFTANDGNLDSVTYTVNLNVLAEGDVAWSRLTSFKFNDSYIYNDFSPNTPTTAWKIKKIDIDSYEELKQNYAGEIQITVEAPVTVENGTATSTAATDPATTIWVSKDAFSGAVSKNGKIMPNNLCMAQTVSGTYASNNSAQEVTITSGDKTTVYYSLRMTVDTGSSDTNTAPTIKTGVENPATATVAVDKEWTLDLDTIFTDAEGNPLTYKVKVNDAAEATINGSTYSYTPPEAVDTTLVFTASDGKLDSVTYTVTLKALAEGDVAWSRLTSFNFSDPYIYDEFSTNTRTTAWKIKDIKIDSYEELDKVTVTDITTQTQTTVAYAGEIQITAEAPVTVEDGKVTETLAKKLPDVIWIATGDFSGAVSKSGEIQKTYPLKMVRTAQGTYASNYYLNEVTISSGDKTTVYYSLRMTFDTGSSDTNTAPTIKTGVENPATATVAVDKEWTLDLADIFVDAEDDFLTYTVKVNGAAEATPINGSTYSYTPDKAGTTTLVFTANDSYHDSETYTVTLKATVVYAITATVDGEYIVNVGNETSPMGATEITVNGTSASEAKAGDHIVVKAVPQKCNLFNTDLYDAKFDHWVVVAAPTGLLSGDELKKADLTFDMPAEAVSLKAVFKAVGSQVTLTASDFNAGDVSLMIGDWAVVASTYDFSARRHAYDSVTRTVIADAKVSATIATGTKNAGYKLTGWEIRNTTKDEPVNFDYDAGYGGIERPCFTVDGTSNYTIKAIFAAKDYGNVNVTVNDESMGIATAQIGTETAAASIDAVVEGTEVKLQAQPKTGYVFQSWSATYGSDNTQVKIANSTAAQTTFVMPATNRQPVNVVATFAEDPNYLSEECVLESVLLLNHSGNTFEGDQDGTAFTVTLPADADASNLANMVLKLTYSKNAKVFRDGDTAAWNANGQACNMTLGTVTKFVVRSQKDLTEGNEGPTREYTITIQKAASPGTPTLSNGSATRTSKTGATVKFTSSEAGNYFYKVVDHGATAPTADEIMKSTTKGTASTGEITFTLSNLTEDARDIYIVVVSAAGGESAPLKVEIPAYGSGTDTPDTGAYKISIRAPKGGTITTNRTKADAGEEIIVTVTPDNGYQMVSGSLSYTLETAGGETKTISNGRFTMPAGDVSITCKWETATTTAKGITSFSINGVAGAVNNSTNTITITMPRGTDVTKLTPVIATNGVKSLTPGNGETVNFTNAVTYTVAMEDGSSKTYTVTVYVDKGTLADQFWDKLTDFATQVPWWQYAEKQQSTSKYPKYW